MRKNIYKEAASLLQRESNHVRNPDYDSWELATQTRSARTAWRSRHSKCDAFHMKEGMGEWVACQCFITSCFHLFFGMLRNQNLILKRIDSFLSNPNAGVLTGERRMGTEQLLDLLADRIAEDSSANIVRIKEKNGLLDRIRSEIIPGKKNHIILYADVDAPESDLVVGAFPYAEVYRAKELCHQVPVCFRESSSEKSYSCERTE